MPQNLRARLERIRNAKAQENSAQSPSPDKSLSPDNSLSALVSSGKDNKESGVKTQRRRNLWHETGYKVLSRTLTMPFTMPADLPCTLSWLLPDLSRNKTGSAALPDLERFLFFDLETTGLSGGAGTVAFLAAFGRFIRNPADRTKKTVRRTDQQTNYSGLEVTQFLLLDYPGENDFLENALSFITTHTPVNTCFLATYNGKAFDIPLLKTRCLMNGLALPQFFQLDLLHPARKIWKRIISSCSQANIETKILGLDRSDDTPGAMAPDIWFNFLRSGEDFTETPQNAKVPPNSKALSGICDHNVKDIFGLVTLFRTFTEIAASPLNAAARFNVDEENLALCWRRHCNLYRSSSSECSSNETNSEINESNNKNEIEEINEKTAVLLLEAAAQNYPRSCLRLGFDLFRRGLYEEGRTKLKQLVIPDAKWKVPCSVTVRALALRSLAIDAERRLKQPDMALKYLENALLPEHSDLISGNLPNGLREDLEKRIKKILAVRQKKQLHKKVKEV